MVSCHYYANKLDPIWSLIYFFRYSKSLKLEMILKSIEREFGKRNGIT